ncbi:glycosyltransferase [Agromyces silvae]|uniref:glycosyltransferase n=1 Tax=Agromyces silvae TaxID=3388266 RepID=UPI00280B750A|nr:glycosyltransferase [Agromyces protaetiae]
MKVDYLIGGFRISVGPTSTTPGPRTHILGFTDALKRSGADVRILLASSFPGMGRFTTVRQADYQAVSRSKLKVMAADLIRITAGLWSGLNVFARSLSRSSRADVLYERVAVFQSLSSFHRAKRRAFRIVEANGVLARETARDRKILAFEGLATWLERRTLRRADLVIAVSAALAAELQVYAGLKSSSILVLPNGADPSTVNLEDKSTPDDPILGFVGSVVAWHRLDALLETIAELRRADPDIAGGMRVEIIGDGPEIQRLTGDAGRLGLADVVTFVGPLAHDAALDRMQAWSIGFAGHEKSSSSVMYHSPLKLYEYAALGLIVACSPSADAHALRAAGADVHMYDSSGDATMAQVVRDALRAAKSDSRQARAERRASVEREHSWDARVNEMMGALAMGETR